MLKKRQTLIIITLLTVFTVTAAIAISPDRSARGEKLFKTSASIDGGKPFNIDSIIPEGKTYLDLSVLASNMGLRYVDRVGNDTIYINNKPFKDFVRYDTKTYVSAQAIGSLFGYKVREDSNGMVVDFLSTGSKENLDERSITISISKKERFHSADKGYYSYRLTCDLRNNTKGVITININDIFLQDNMGEEQRCQGNAEYVIKPGETVKIDRIYFLLTNKFGPKFIILKHDKTAIGKGYW